MTTRSCLQSRSQSRARGRELELRIERVFDQINAMPGILAIRIEVKQVRVAGRLVYIRPQPFDYMILTKSFVFGFDAKETRKDRFYPLQQPEHQLAALKKMQGMGYRAGWVVWFRACDDPTRSLRWIEDVDTPATVTSGEIFDWEMFL